MEQSPVSCCATPRPLLGKSIRTQSAGWTRSGHKQSPSGESLPRQRGVMSVPAQSTRTRTLKGPSLPSMTLTVAPILGLWGFLELRLPRGPDFFPSPGGRQSTRDIFWGIFSGCLSVSVISSSWAPTTPPASQVIPRTLGSLYSPFPPLSLLVLPKCPA